MVLHAGGVRRLLLPDQVDERATLEAVERAGREALTEAQWLLGVLHAAEHDESAPAPGLAAFAEPFEPARAAGIRTVVTVTGDVRPLSADPELAAATGAKPCPALSTGRCSGAERSGGRTGGAGRGCVAGEVVHQRLVLGQLLAEHPAAADQHDSFRQRQRVAGLQAVVDPGDEQLGRAAVDPAQTGAVGVSTTFSRTSRSRRTTSGSPTSTTASVDRWPSQIRFSAIR